ncbi:MAG: menaquinone biosynthesis protein [Nitrospiraceae bacterium]|nr:menaquinone biosynthesis protein [Nitrospiraceae bacterium]
MPEELRIGRIFYLNLYPIFHGLDKTAPGGRYLYFDGHPARVNAWLRTGGVDLSPSSSIVYLREPGDFSLIEGHSVSADGPIRSIYLFSRFPLEELGGRLIGVTNQTETSVALLRIILGKFLGLDHRIRVTALPAARALSRFSAYLAIGDDAMRARKDFTFEGRFRKNGPVSSGDLFVYDLGEIWREKTGLPFVFALWIARKESMKAKRRAFGQFKRDLDSAKGYALSHLGEAARRQPVAELSRQEVIRYWKGISYGLGPAEKKGLRLFGRYARELGLL